MQLGLTFYNKKQQYEKVCIMQPGMNALKRIWGTPSRIHIWGEMSSIRGKSQRMTVYVKVPSANVSHVTENLTYC